MTNSAQQASWARPGERPNWLAEVCIVGRLICFAELGRIALAVPHFRSHRGQPGRVYLPYWKVRFILSIMETSGNSPTPDEATAALLAASSARDRLSHQLTLPSLFYTSIGLAVIIQITTVAVGVAEQNSAGFGLAVGGLVLSVLIAVVQLIRFRRLNGVWVGGLASRVVFGGDAAASTAHLLAMGFAIWAAFEERWWLVGLCAIAGGVGYALCGVRWMRSYRGDPAAHSRGESALLLVVLAVLVLAGAVLLVSLH